MKTSWMLLVWCFLAVISDAAPAAPPTTISAAPGAPFHVSEAQRRWWAFQRIRPVVPPSVKNSGRLASPIDQFIRAKLAARGITPAGRADKRTLIRRATLDLTGLPPSPEQVEAFVRDNSPDAFSRVVDRLLSSSAYGERFARHWLDVVRYADYHDGNPAARTASCEPLQAWRYRDWVVSAFNRDMPFDQFIVHQIAGDLLPAPDNREFYADGLIATTFLSNGTWDRGDADKEKMVSDMVDDQIDTIGKAFLGLTLGCARCHNHKFDPVSQSDYYALAGIFYSTHILKDIGAKGGEYTLNRVPLAQHAYVTKRESQLKQLGELNAQLAELDKKMPKPAADEPGRLMLVSQRDRLQGELLAEPPLAEAAQEGGTLGGLFPNIQDVPIHIRGSYTRLGAVVPRRLPAFFAGEAQPPITRGSGRRELADWIVSKDNPLTSRVIVNRVWQWHFGMGLVRTPNNFGMLSEPPSHPELLDWLASRFVEDGRSLKKLNRRIMLSAAYQQSSSVPRKQLVQDPENRWLGRFASRRLEAEVIRDSMLSAAGKLDPALGRPASADLSITRRSLYVQTARWDRGSFATLFDAANPDACVEKRNVSTVAPQALFLLNNDFVLSQARQLAQRLARDAPVDETARIQRAYQLLFARPATVEEIKIDRQFLAQDAKRIGPPGGPPESGVGARPAETRSTPGAAGSAPIEAAKPGTDTAWWDLMHVLLCSNEFAYLD